MSTLPAPKYKHGDIVYRAVAAPFYGSKFPYVILAHVNSAPVLTAVDGKATWVYQLANFSPYETKGGRISFNVAEDCMFTSMAEAEKMARELISSLDTLIAAEPDDELPDSITGKGGG